MKSRFNISLLFALAAALAYVPWLLVTVPWLGRSLGQGLFAVSATAAYLALTAPRPALRLHAAILTAAGGGVLWLLMPGDAARWLSLAVVMAAVRSVILYRRRSPARALAVDATLLLGGLLAAKALAGPTLLGGALAVWGFLLVQSLFFLITDVETRGESSDGDPFEEAHLRATRLLEQTGV
ncbi:MAG: hypothetical protein AAGM22_09310 [Acidobacteriota bacterium]